MRKVLLAAVAATGLISASAHAEFTNDEFIRWTTCSQFPNAKPCRDGTWKNIPIPDAMKRAWTNARIAAEAEAKLRRENPAKAAVLDRERDAKRFCQYQATLSAPGTAYYYHWQDSVNAMWRRDDVMSACMRWRTGRP